MENCDKCGRILYLIDIEIRKTESPNATKRNVPHLDKTYYCTHCRDIKTKGL